MCQRRLLKITQSLELAPRLVVHLFVLDLAFDSLGLDNEMMLVRACYMFKPVFPSTGLGYAFTKDGSGRSKMVSLAAFVQEPR